MKKRLHAFISILLIFTLTCCQKIGDSHITYPEMTPPTLPVVTETTTTETPESETSAETETTTTASPATTTTSPETTTTPPTTTTTPPTTTTAPPTTTTAPTTTTTAPPTTTPAPVTTTPAPQPNSYTVNSYNALNYGEQKGVWIAYLEYMSMMTDKSKQSFTTSINKAFDNIKGLGFNTVYVQVRAHGDAYYSSSLFPSGKYYDGKMGGGMDYDPLAIMVKSAHDRGLSIHAWINPMRLGNDSDIRGISDSYLYKKWYNDDNRRGKMVVKSGDFWYLNPAYGDCIDLIADGVAEILSNYNVDGIQIDDYFYPTQNASFDKSAYAASGTSLSLTDWRYQNVNRMVKRLYNTVHGVSPDAVFGISPQGVPENNDPLYADVSLWCKTAGYCDYILPQVYMGFEHATAPYSELIRSWNSMVKSSGVKLVIGLAPYKIGLSDSWAGKGKTEWQKNNNIISRQMADAKKISNYGGVALYRYGSLFEPEQGVAAAVAAEVSLIE